jgi:cell shape-determining protein MreC
MRDANLTVRNYIIYIIFVFFSFSLMVLDFFSNQEISTTISKRINFLVPSDINFNEYFEFFNSDLFQTRNNLINENVRLKNEILELRELRVENDLLKEELESNQNLIESVDVFNYFYIKTSPFMRNQENHYLVSGGYDKNFVKNDIVVNEDGFVIGFVDKIFQNHSEVIFIYDSAFSMPAIDKFGNEYLVENNGEELLIYTTSVNELTSNIDFIFTDSKFGQPSRFPILSLNEINVTVDENKISTSLEIEDVNFSFTDIYVVKANDLP